MKNDIKCQILNFGSNEHLESIELRRMVLRKPLGLDFDEQDLAKEVDQYHFAIFYKEKVVGILLLKLMKDLSDSILKMRQVAIHPDFQSNGLGTILVEYSEKWAVRNGFKIIDLHARNSAIEFYKKMNYSTIGEEFLEVNIPHIRMVKDL